MSGVYCDAGKGISPSRLGRRKGVGGWDAVCGDIVFHPFFIKTSYLCFLRDNKNAAKGLKKKKHYRATWYINECSIGTGIDYSTYGISTITIHLEKNNRPSFISTHMQKKTPDGLKG